MGFIKNLMEKLVPVPRELGYILAIDSKKILYMISITEEKKKKEYIYTVSYEIGRHGVKEGPISHTEVIPVTAFNSMESFKETFYNLKGLKNFPENSFQELWDQIQSKLD